MIKNIINFIFTFFLFIIILIALWKNISNNGPNDLVAKPYTIPEFRLNQILPLGTDSSGNDYMVKFSIAFSNNLYNAFITTSVFIMVSIIFGLGIGFRPEKRFQGQDIFSLNNLKQVYFDFCSFTTDAFQSVPILIIVLAGNLFFQRNLDNTNDSLFYTLIVVAVFSSPKLSNALGNHIKQLNREEFILATKASGVSIPSLIIKHILYYEAIGLIILQFVNFFFFTIMIEIFLGFFGKAGSNLSLGNLIGSNQELYAYWEFLPTFQWKLNLMFPLIFVLIFCVVIRWMAGRILLLTEAQ